MTLPQAAALLIFLIFQIYKPSYFLKITVLPNNQSKLF